MAGSSIGLANVNVGGAGGGDGGSKEHSGRFVLALFLIWGGVFLLFFAIEGLAVVDEASPATGAKSAWRGIFNALRAKVGTAGGTTPTGQAGDGGAATGVFDGTDQATPGSSGTATPSSGPSSSDWVRAL